MTLTKTASYLAHKQREAAALGDLKLSLRQVAVALGSQTPDPGPLLREAMRLAAQANALWHVVYVCTPDEAPAKIPRALQLRISDTLDLAQRLGGIPVVLNSEDVSQALISFAGDYSIAHMVMGRPIKSLRSHWRFRPSLIELLTRELTSVNFVII